MAKRWGKSGNSDRFYFWGLQVTSDGDWSHEIKGYLFLGRKTMINLDYILKSRDITLPTKVHIVQSYGFSSSHIQMWELYLKEDWEPKNRCFWTVVLEKTLESPLDSKEIKSVSPKWNQPWVFIGRTDAEAEVSISWELLSHWKRPDAGKVWG